MSNFKEKGFFKSIFSLSKAKEQNEEKIKETKVEENEPRKNNLVQKSKVKKRIWKKDCNPIRSVILWGYDNEDNPSFLILYGEHKFKNTENNGQVINNTFDDNGEGINNTLEDDVKYTSYALFKGKEGHLPAFQTVKIIDDTSYYSRRNMDTAPKMYYKTGLKSYWRRDENYRVKEFVNLNVEEQIVLPYFTDDSYEDYVKVIEEKNISFQDFKLVKHPNEILKLNEECFKYYEIICDMVSSENLYIRKKSLNELLEMEIPQNIFDLLMKIGSTELISGLFLELSKRKNPVLVKEAENILESNITWGEESYIKGVKRCAHIYCTTFCEEARAKRTKHIYEALPYMDLHLIKINDNDIPEGKILEGAAYRKYANQGLLREYHGRYDYGQRKWVEYRCSQRYKISDYCDGVILKSIEFKNTIQEAEAYGLADVIGKIAYYLDAPRLNYYFRGNGKTRELKYYKRYVRKIIDSYGENDSEKFVQAMKALLTSYTEHDYVCKFKGNFQFNEFLKHYLYYDFNEKPPVGWDNWRARSIWMENDQLMKLQGRYEFKKEIWDNHLKDVLEIASKSKINPVLKACYYILKDSKNTQSFIDNMSYKELIGLTEGSYEPLANMFKDLLHNKLNSVNTFNSEIMIVLMSSPKQDIQNLAKEFMNKTNGEFSAHDLIDVMMLKNIEVWTDLFKEKLLTLGNREYCDFIQSIINNSNKFISTDISVSKEIKDALSLSAGKIQDMSEDERADLISRMIVEILNTDKMIDWIEEFIEEVIFSASYKDLENLLKKITIKQTDKLISQKAKQILSLLQAMQNKKLPSDFQITGILESGTSKMINMLFNNIEENSKELSERFSTLLIMLESDVTLLNQKAEEIFENMDEEKRKKLHGIIIDSPVKKVYSFGLRKLDEIYKDLIPKEFVIQMLEHNSSEVKNYISDKTKDILNNLGNGDKELFMYYMRTLLFLPNKVSKGKDNLYEVIPKFVIKHKDKLEEVENILLDIGSSNIILDSERALTTLAIIRKEAV